MRVLTLTRRHFPYRLQGRLPGHLIDEAAAHPGGSVAQIDALDGV